MLAIITTNLLRSRARTVFTAGGIAVGVATIVALLSFTQGLQRHGGRIHPSRRLGARDLPGQRLGPDRLDPARRARGAHSRAARRHRRHATAADDRNGQVRSQRGRVRRRSERLLHAQPGHRRRRARTSGRTRNPDRGPPRRTAAPGSRRHARRQGTAIPGRGRLSLRRAVRGLRRGAGDRPGPAAERPRRGGDRRGRAAGPGRARVGRRHGDRTRPARHPGDRRPPAGPARRRRRHADLQRDPRDRGDRADRRSDQRRQHDGHVDHGAPGRARAAEHRRLVCRRASRR